MADSADAAALVPFGRYVIRARMAAGGMGEVFRGVAVGADGFEKPIAIKRILPELARRSGVSERLADEAKLMTRLIHPNIVQVLDFGRSEGGDAFLVMELIRGLDLGAFCAFFERRGEHVAGRIALFVTQQTLRGLAYAHSTLSAAGQRLVHRDVSPGNVLLSCFGEVKVSDFGVALVAAAAELRGDGSIVGKPAYMAPEQRALGAVDERADLYALGAVLFRMLVGRTPEDRELERGSAQLQPDVSMSLGASASLLGFVAKALAPDPARRFADANEMARALQELVTEGADIASADDLAAQVAAAVQEEGAGDRPVLVLGAPRDSLRAGTELSRGTHRAEFTMTLPGAPTPRTPLLARLPRLRVLRAALAMLLGVAVWLLLRPSGGAPGRPAPRVASAPAYVQPDRAPPPLERHDAESPLVEHEEPPTHASGHATRARSRARPSAATLTPETAPGCRGQLHVFATHGWLLRGGPEEVQAPGRYEWPCGSYQLSAVSRLDSRIVRQLSTRVRATGVSVIDLRAAASP